MNPFWVQVVMALGAIGAFVGMLIVLPSAVVKVINEWLRKPRFELKIWCVPSFEQPVAGHMYCIVKLKVLKKMKGHEWLYLYPNTDQFLIGEVLSVQARYRTVRQYQTRVSVFASCAKLMKSISGFSCARKMPRPIRILSPKMVDYHLSPKIRRRKLNISIDVLPE